MVRVEIFHVVGLNKPPLSGEMFFESNNFNFQLIRTYDDDLELVIGVNDDPHEVDFNPTNLKFDMTPTEQCRERIRQHCEDYGLHMTTDLRSLNVIDPEIDPLWLDIGLG